MPPKRKAVGSGRGGSTTKRRKVRRVLPQNPYKSNTQKLFRPSLATFTLSGNFSDHIQASLIARYE